MIMKNIILSLLAFLLVSPAALAQYQTKGTNSDLTKAQRINLSIKHPTYLEPKQFAIMMQTPDAVSGCFTISPLEYEAKFIDGNFMDITVKGYTNTPVKSRDSFACNQNIQTSNAMVVMNANDLKNRNIKKIRFSNGDSNEYFDIKHLENGIKLTPELTPRAFQIAGGAKALIYYYNTNGLLKLQVPMALPSDDVTQQLNALALDNGLTYSDKPHHFMDNTGEVAAQFNDDGYYELGTIQIPRPYNGANGMINKAVPLKVFATRPETTL